jgi:hypothetical protein
MRPRALLGRGAAGTYRLARIDGFLEDVHPATVPGVVSPSTFSLSLNGIRMQFGMRFRF